LLLLVRFPRALKLLNFLRMKRAGKSKARNDAAKRFARGERIVPLSRAGPSISAQRDRAVANLRVGGVAGLEKKYFDGAVYSRVWSSGSGAFDATCLMGPINSVQAGTGPSNRDGRVCTAHSVLVQGVLSVGAGDTIGAATLLRPSSARTVFVCLVLDTTPNGVLMSPGGGDGLCVNPAATYAPAYDNSTAATNNQYRSDGMTMPLRNLQDGGRYRILAVKRCTISVTAVVPRTVGDDSQLIYNTANFRFFRKLNFDVNFINTPGSGIIGDMSTNALYVFACESLSDGPSTAGATTLVANTRFRFTG